MNFPVTYLGNKKLDIKHFKHLLPDKSTITTVGEPFAGSFSIIRCYYSDVQKLVCSDNDLEYRKRLKNIFDDLPAYQKEKKRINSLITPSKTKKSDLAIMMDVSSNIFFVPTDFSARGMTKQISENFDYKDLKKIYDRIEWHDDFRITLNKYNQDASAFIFLDPPYFQSYNKSYEGNEYKDLEGNLKDNTAFFVDILHYFQTSKAKLMMILNKSAIIEYIYKDFVKGSYDKQYGFSRNKEKLLIITNYTL